MRQLIPKLSLRSFLFWAGLLTALLLIGAFAVYREHQFFLSDILLNSAFTILSSVFVAIVITQFLEAREQARWANFDTSNLRDLRNTLYQLIYEALQVPTFEACVRTNISFISDPFDYMLEVYRRDPAMFLAYVGSVKSLLDHLHKTQKNIVDAVFFERSRGFVKHLTTLDQLLQRTVASPHAPIEIIDSFGDLLENGRLLEPFLSTNPNILVEQRAEAITLLSLNIIEAALIAYETTTHALSDRDF